ncbi:MAG TPA: NAD(P)H-hydrate epimerase [Nitrososphaerales archaeon]|nr:NAD(P)H-hydrate epimerase [Nitrososphaerales archaeon]
MDYITPDEMRRLEKEAPEYGVSVRELMENAGRAVADVVLSRYGPGKRVCVVCGGGNNGGDGFVAARYLSALDDVEVVLLTDPGSIRTEEAKENWRLLSGTRAHMIVAAEERALLENSREIESADILVAAIFGTGVSGGIVKEPYATAISLVNASKAIKVAIDLPSGLDPQTGQASRPSVRADVTVALHLPKVGLRGREELTGEVVVVKIGIKENR